MTVTATTNAGGGAEGGAGGIWDTSSGEDGKAFGGGGGGGGAGVSSTQPLNGGNGAFGGGIGVTARGGDGGDFSGGGSSVSFGSVPITTPTQAGNGGYGGGGGSTGDSGPNVIGGDGGFGGGGMSSTDQTGGKGGFGGGNGSTTGGGGGAAFGGAVFVRSGGTLVIRGAGTISGGAVTGGAGAGNGGKGAESGKDIYLQNATLELNAGTGLQQSFDVSLISDDSGNPDANSDGTADDTSLGGRLFKTGDGTTTLTGTGAYGGGTFVKSGLLVVNGTVSSQVTVEGGKLGGTGRLMDMLRIKTGGTVAPGNSIGKIKVDGDVTFDAGSTYEVELNAAGQSDLIEAGGKANLASGATLAVNAETGTYPDTSPIYTVLTAEGGVNGTFGTVTDNLPDVDFTAEYRTNDVRLTYKPSKQVSPKEVNSASMNSAGTAGALFNSALNGHSPSQTQNNQRLSFKNVPGVASISTQNSMQRDWTVWTTAVGQKITVGSSGGLSGWRATVAGGVIGFDTRVDWGLPAIATAAAGYTSTKTTVGSSSATINTTHVGAAASVQSGAWTIDAGLSYGNQNYSTSRSVPVGTTTRTALGKTSGTTFGVSLNSYVDISGKLGSQNPSVSFGPVMGLDWFQTRQAGYTETGAGVLNLNVASSTTTTSAARLGMAGSLNKSVNGATVALDGMIALERTLGDRSSTSVSSLAITGQQFTTRAAPVGLNRAVIGLGASVDFGKGATAYVSYEGRLDAHASDHSATLGLSYKF